MFGLTTTRRLRAELATKQALLDEARDQRDKARGNYNSAQAALRTAARQFAEADADNRRLHGRLLELGRRISQLTESDPSYAADLERQLAAARKEADAEKTRADHLQKRLDDAVGLTKGGVQDSSVWQPGYVAPKPKAGAS